MFGADSDLSGRRSSAVIAAYRPHAAARGADRGHTYASQDAPSRNGAPETPIRRVIDEAQFLDGYDTWPMEKYLEGMYRESGADIRLIFAHKVPEDIESFSRRRARTLGMGRESDKRGLLLVYDVDGQRIRVEVGPGMEGVFPDGFVGYLIREQTALFFAAGNRMLGLKSTLFVITNRLREAALNENYDPRVVTYIRDSVPLAAGGGATTHAALSSDRNALHTAAMTHDTRARFGPQPTVARALARYQEALRDGYFQPDLPLYATGSERVLRGFPITAPYAAFILFSEYGHQYTIVERGDLAILFFTSTPLVSVHLFRHSAVGWQMDIAAEVRDTRERVGGPYTWEMRKSDDDYWRTFADLFSDYGGLLRPTAGDNRRLSIRNP